MKYISLFVLIFLVILYKTGQGQTTAVSKMSNVSFTKTKKKKRWTYIDRVCLLGQIACTNILVMADSPGVNPRNLTLGFLKPGDTLSQETRIHNGNKFLNVLYPFAVYDSVQLFQTLTLLHCSDTSNCKPLIYDIKKFGLTKLTVKQRLKNVLSILALQSGCKVDTMVDHKLRINVVMTLDTSSCWQSYRFMKAYATKVAFVIYDYVLPASKEKEYFSVQFYFTEPDGREKEGIQIFFDHPIFKRMYQLPSAQLLEMGNYEITGHRSIVDTSVSRDEINKLPLYNPDEMPLYKKVARVVLKKVTNMEEYRQLKDTVEWFFKERVFFRAIVGPADSVLNRNDLPITVFIPTESVKEELETFEENGLHVLAQMYTQSLRPYQHFKTISLTSRLTDKKETKEFTTVYYLQPAKDINEEKRIAVYCRKKKKWMVVIIPKPEYQYDYPGYK